MRHQQPGRAEPFHDIAISASDGARHRDRGQLANFGDVVFHPRPWHQQRGIAAVVRSIVGLQTLLAQLPVQQRERHIIVLTGRQRRENMVADGFLAKDRCVRRHAETGQNEVTNKTAEFIEFGIPAPFEKAVQDRYVKLAIVVAVSARPIPDFLQDPPQAVRILVQHCKANAARTDQRGRILLGQLRLRPLGQQQAKGFGK